VTTIKVTKTLRDRITAGAARRDQTVQRLIESVLDTYDRERRSAAVSAAMKTASADELRQWRDDTDSWATIDNETEGAR